MKNNQGFTIIELIIVIVLIAIIATLSAPYFFTLQEKGYISVMLGDVDKIRTYEEIYTQYNENYTDDITQLRDLGFDPSGDNAIDLSLSNGGFIVIVSNPNVDNICVSSSGNVNAVDLPSDPASSPGETKCN